MISTKTKPQSSSARSYSIAALALPLLALAALWFVLCRHLSSEWSVNEQYSYGWFVPFFAAILFWLRWEDRPKPQAAAEVRGQTSEVGRPRAEGESEANAQPAYAEGFGVAGAHLSRRSESEGGTPNIQRPIKNWRDQRSDGKDGRSEVPPSVAAATYVAAGGDQSLAISNQQSAISNNNRTLVAASLAIPALLLLLPLRVFEIGNADWRLLGWIHAASVVVLTLIYIWYVGGQPWLRHFAFPIAFIFVAVPWISPIEQPIVQGLMRIVAAVAAETLTLFGIPAQLEGSLIRIPSGLVGVNEACSGVRSLQTALMIGLLFGELKRFDLTRRFALIVTAIAISLIANCGRAFFLVWVAANSGIAAVDRWHGFAGYSIVALVFGGTMILAAWMGRGQPARPPSKLQAPSSKLQTASSGLQAPSSGLQAPFTIPREASAFYAPPRFALLALTWLLFVEVASAAWYRAHEHNLAVRTRWTVHWPTLPGLRDLKIDEGVRQILRFDEGRAARWQAESSVSSEPEARTNAPTPSSYTLFFFRWNPGSGTVLRARAHRPDICLPSTGWRQTAEHQIRRYDIGSNFALPFQHFEFVHKRRGPFERDQFVHAFFCLQEDNLRQTESRPDLNISDGSQPDWSVRGRTRVVLNGVRNLGQQTMELVLMSPVEINSSEAEERFSHLVRDLIVVDAKKSE